MQLDSTATYSFADVQDGVMTMDVKTCRIADSDLATLLRLKERMPEPHGFREVGEMEKSHRVIETASRRRIYLSEKADASFRRLLKTVESYLPSRNVLASEDIYEAFQLELGRLYESESRSIDIATFLASVEAAVESEVTTHRFYTTLDGLQLGENSQLRIGRLTVEKPSLVTLEGCDANEAMISSIWDRVGRGLWISGEITGSRKYAERLFFEDVKNACGLLAISLSASSDRGSYGVRLTPNMPGRVRPSASTWFSIEMPSKTLSTSASIRGFQSVSVDDEYVEGLHSSDWFVGLARILQEPGQNDAESAIRRAIYWFYDAQADTSPEMQLVKFWSCIECFFSFENSGQTTQKIKRGLTALLTFGNFRFSRLEVWRNLEKEIDASYELRSTAVHDARHSHVSDRDITIVSKWAAWAILEMSGLVADGYQSRDKIKEQTDRLSDLLRKERNRKKGDE